MALILATLLGGVLGTIAMTLFLLFPRWLNLGRVDVIRAVGTLVTKREDGAFGIGITMHLVSGIFWAFFYLGFMTLSRLPLNLMTGVVAGTVHGAIVMLLVCIAIMEHHPVRRFHERGPMTGVMQLLAHILYGAIVGSTVHLLAPAAE